MGSVSGHHEAPANCADCGDNIEGESFLYPTEQARNGSDAASFCAQCFSGKNDHSGCVVLTRKYDRSPTESPDQRFEALFKAARVLLRARIDNEDKVIPTLRLAQGRGQQAPRVLYEAVRVTDVIEGIPILERTQVKVRDHRSLSTGALTAFTVCLFASRGTASAEEIANSYEKALKAQGVAWENTGGRISYDLHRVRGYYLLLTVERSRWSSINRSEAWPSPTFVGKTTRAAFDEFSERLVVRRSGGGMNAENLIPASVAYLLKHPLPKSTAIDRRGEIHRLLNEHVLCEIPWKEPLREKNYADDSPSTQLWRDVKKMEQLEERLPDIGPLEIK